MWKLFSEMRQEFKKLYLVYKFLGVSWIIKEFRVLMGSWFLIVSWLLIQSLLLIGSWLLPESWTLIGSFVLTVSGSSQGPGWVLGPLRVLDPAFLVCHFDVLLLSVSSPIFLTWSLVKHLADFNRQLFPRESSIVGV